MPMNNTILVAGVLPSGAGATWSLPSTGFVNPMYITSPVLGSTDATGFDITGAGTVSISFEGTYTGQTVLHQQTADPSGLGGWFTVTGTSADGSTDSSGGSATGVCYNFAAVGVRHRIQVSALASGTIACRIVADQESLVAIGAQSGTGTSATQVQGNAASGATDVGNPVKVGGVFNTSQITITTGQRGDLQLTSLGELKVQLSNGGVQPTTPISIADGESNGSSVAGLRVYSRNSTYNGTTWDRLYSIQGAATTGSAGLGVLAVEEAGRTFSNIKTATTTTSKSGKGFLHTITINTFVASATITVYDNTTGSGTTIATITLPSTITSLGPLTLAYDVAFATGLTIVTSGATDITVAYR